MNNNWKRFSHLFLLTNLSIAQPLFQDVSKHPEFFVAHGASRLDLIATALLLSLLLPFLLFSIVWLVSLFHTKSSRAVHSVFLLILVTLLCLSILKKIFPAAGLPLIVTAVVLGLLFVWFYQHSSNAFQTMTLISPVAIVVPLLFLLQQPVRSMLQQTGRTELRTTAASTPVVLVILDELPLTSLIDANGNIDDVRYPNFAKLAAGSQWYRNATTCSSLTDLAVPAILTGNYPERSRLPVASEYPDNLFSLVGGSYDLHVQEAITMLNPKTQAVSNGWNRIWVIWKDLAAIYLHLVVPGRFEEALPVVTETWGNFWDEEKEVNRAGDFRKFVHEISNHPSSQSLHFLHTMLPHKPWVYLPSGKEYRDYGSLAWGTAQNNRGVWQDNHQIIARYQKRHLLQLGFVDRLIGELIHQLKETGLYQSSLLIVTSDHGVGFWPGESLRKPSQTTMQDILYVPLFVKLPGQTTGAIDDKPVETVDILPTIADVLRIELPWNVVGESLLEPARSRRKHRTRIRPTNEFVKFKNNFSIESVTFQHRLNQIGARTTFDGFFQLPVLTIPPADPRLKQMKALVLDADAYANVDLKSNFLPAYISGIVKAPPDSGPFTVQILVNGMTRAVTETFPTRRGTIRFGELVPESSFQQGKNKIEVLILK